MRCLLFFDPGVWFGGSFSFEALRPLLLRISLQENLSNRNAVALVMEYFITPGLRLGYAYDFIDLNALERQLRGTSRIRAIAGCLPEEVSVRL